MSDFDQAPGPIFKFSDHRVTIKDYCYYIAYKDSDRPLLMANQQNNTGKIRVFFDLDFAQKYHSYLIGIKQIKDGATEIEIMESSSFLTWCQDLLKERTDDVCVEAFGNENGVNAGPMTLYRNKGSPN